MLCLAGSLYSVHCLVPPHPGITAATGLLNADTGRMILFGTVLAIPGAIISAVWARYADRWVTPTVRINPPPVTSSTELIPPAGGALLAVLLPIALIAMKPLVLLNATAVSASALAVIGFMGDPLMALTAGLLLAAGLRRGWTKAVFNGVLNDAIHKAGPVLVIVGAGGAFGEVIRHIGLEVVITDLTRTAGSGTVPLWLPFLLTVVLKTAQGSSTVAILTVSSLLQPVLSGLGVDTDWEKLLVLGAMGAGSMSVSHANDAYFWVVSRFGQLTDTTLMLRTYSVQSALMGLGTFVYLWLLQWLF